MTARPLLPEHLVPAARRVYREDRAFNSDVYKPGEGPFHWATGSWWPDHLRERARAWRNAAQDADDLAAWMEANQIGDDAR